MPGMDLVLEVIKQWGPPGIVALLMWVMLQKSEKRESAKDQRIQLLENQLIESYDERINAADRISDAIHGSASAANNAAEALKNLTHEVRTSHGKVS